MIIIGIHLKFLRQLSFQKTLSLSKANKSIVNIKKKEIPERFSKKYRLRLTDYWNTRMSVLSETEKQLIPLRDAVKEMGDLVRKLKLDGAAKSEIDKVVLKLKERKKILEEKEAELAPKEIFFDRFKFEDLLKRRFFYDQSFAIYGGVAGLYDFGPMGCALKSNIIQKWRKHFILAEGMLEVECSALTPEDVLKTSGHVERFSDFMCKDTKTGACLRADHLIKECAEKLLKDKNTNSQLKEELETLLIRLDGYDDKEMSEIIKKYNFKSPITGNDVSSPECFNLMFSTQIGPTGDFKAYLRPETAQGIFINFKRLLEFSEGKLPFAAAQIGLGFRNEISPRQGLIRVREFTMCEIEHFVDPTAKQHHKFSKVKDIKLTLYSACNQYDGKSAVSMSIGDAVAQKIVDNESLGFYMARTHLFMISVGIDPNRLRFRQHMTNEMAHYAKDCWDAECLTSHGWIECVGHADRSCYDLLSHSKATNVRLTAEKPLKEPKKINVVEAVPLKQTIGSQFKGDAKHVIATILSLSQKEITEIEKAWKESKAYLLTTKNGIQINLTKELMDIKRYEKTLHVEEVTPSVIEPSFGIGRVMYAVLEHAFRQRKEDEKRVYLEIVPEIAPIKCSILPISANERLDPIIEAVQEQLSLFELSHKIDNSSSSIGRRYARTDEIGIPFGVTIDFESEKKPWTVTLRHASSMQQIRLEVADVGKTVCDLVYNRLTWDQATKIHPIFQANTVENK